MGWYFVGLIVAIGLSFYIGYRIGQAVIMASLVGKGEFVIEEKVKDGKTSISWELRKEKEDK